MRRPISPRVSDLAPRAREGTARDHRPNFYFVVILQHLILCHQVVAADDEMGFLNQAQVPKQFLDPFGPLDLEIALRLAQPNVHA